MARYKGLWSDYIIRMGFTEDFAKATHLFQGVKGFSLDGAADDTIVAAWTRLKVKQFNTPQASSTMVSTTLDAAKAALPWITPYAASWLGDIIQGFGVGEDDALALAESGNAEVMGGVALSGVVYALAGLYGLQTAFGNMRSGTSTGPAPGTVYNALLINKTVGAMIDNAMEEAFMGHLMDVLKANGSFPVLDRKAVDDLNARRVWIKEWSAWVNELLNDFLCETYGHKVVACNRHSYTQQVDAATTFADLHSAIILYDNNATKGMGKVPAAYVVLTAEELASKFHGKFPTGGVTVKMLLFEDYAHATD